MIRDQSAPYRVTHLDLIDCRLKGALPHQIGQLASLQTLNLSHNALTSLPPEIGRLSSLGSYILTTIN
ncbi:MAG: hypothetical protein WC763_06820 [Candidatus Paceibacterota bacterium]